MPQNRETGRRGNENGYRNADTLGKLLHAKRVSKQSNEFELAGRRVLLKTGQRGAVASGATLNRVAAVIYGYQDQDHWIAFEVPPMLFREQGTPSLSTSHVGRDFLQLSKTQCTRLGRQILS
jgi:hypothetical protein